MALRSLCLHVNVSIGTAAVLGLADVAMDAAPTTAYLMLGGRCVMDCGFCAQARSSQASALKLSRITWPEFDQARTLALLAQAVERGDIRRCCLQVTVAQGYFQRTLEVIRAVRATCPCYAGASPPRFPVDAAILPRDMDQVEELLAAGVDHVGFGLDAAGERVFQRVKSGSWTRSLSLIEETARRFPGRGAVHLIVGLGETEREMAEMIQQMHDLGLVVGLFAFTPVRGTRMEGASPPPIATYRRMQVAQHLITNNLARIGNFTFSTTGQLLSFNLPRLPEILADGVAFQTSGCPDCNRPFYNERPGRTMYNYPKALTPKQTKAAVKELCCWVRPMIGLKRGTVQVVSYQPAWKKLFEEEAARLRSALRDHLLQIEHVGSTAIVGMDAKPIIDIIVAVESFDKARELVPVVEALGYKYKENDDVPERVFLVKGPPSRRTRHLSLTEPTTAYWQAHVLFRDYLRTHPEAVEEYRQLKRELAEQYPEDRGSYTAGKKRFIERILQLARSKA